MSPSRSLLVLFAASIVVLVALDFVLTRNQSAGVYPIEADSISIPLIEGVVILGLVLLASGVGLLVPARGFFRVVSLFFSAIAALLLGMSAWFWAIPNHYELALAYGILLAIFSVAAFKKHVPKNL